MNPFFNEIKKNFGFGCMRLPMKGDEVDVEEFTKMVDTFIENGFNYFDTAHGYVDEKSETALRECLTSRYPREAYILTDKLSPNYFDKQEEIRPFFESQLEACGVEYFDFYLLHNVSESSYDIYTNEELGIVDYLLEEKKAGRIRHLGFSAHGRADTIERFLNWRDCFEFVQIQLNYLDWDLQEARLSYELLQKRDGLMLGICNGFQALIKLGLVPYGEIRPITQDCPTLTFNTVGRHQSMLVDTRIASTKSPWLSRCKLDEVHTIAISHGEGRFVASDEVVRRLIAQGQIVTQYVDKAGMWAMDQRYNPNGSVLAIEGITSPDGRVLGKMGHTERSGNDLYKNVPGNKYQPLFEGGVDYFKL